jgi:aminoglycoside phosphotransferase (APT) family kinase protein
MPEWNGSMDRSVQRRPKTPTRDVASLCERFLAWVQPLLGTDQTPKITVQEPPGSSGFSSETILFDLGWRNGAQTRSGSFVMRLPPASDAYPLFPAYDLGRQATAMKIVRAHTGAPVPTVCWEDFSGDVLGVPFFVMEQIDGKPAPDMPPYVFDSWITAASPAQLAQMEKAVVSTLAQIHRPSNTAEQLLPLELAAEGDSQLTRHMTCQRAYYEWIRADSQVPLVDACFAALEERRPPTADSPTISWGDARLANLLFRDFEIVAVLDWESVAVGPRELDLGWLIYFRDYFQRLAERYGRRGLPDFLPRERVVDRYTQLTGWEPRDLNWYIDYAALRQALVSIRVSQRAIAFGERPEVSDPNDLILDRQYLEGMLS